MTPNNKAVKKAKAQKAIGFDAARTALPMGEWQWAESDNSADPVTAHIPDYAYWVCDTPLGSLRCYLEGKSWLVALDRFNWGPLPPDNMYGALYAEMMKLRQKLGLR